MIKIPRHIGTLLNGGFLELHEDAVTQGFADFGKRGRGKSNLLGCMLETFARRKQSFVVLDPPDAHWGIRYAVNEDGKPCGPSGLDVLIVGGPHPDVPLDPNGGKELAQIIVQGDVSCVICLKSLGYTQQQRFCADFGEELFRINQTPRHIAFEEAHNFMPQNLKFDEQKRVLYSMLKIITDGRGAGLGFTLASQRPAEVNKTALEEVDNFFAFGMIGPNDLDQISRWFKHHVGKDKEKLLSIIDDIAQLKPGECWFLSPEWMKEIVKFKARLRTTYHAGRTPKPGERSVNVDKFTVTEAVQRLKKLFASKQAETRKEVADLKEAKLRIRELETEVRKTKAKPEPKSISTDPKAMMRAIQKAVADAERPLKVAHTELMKMFQKQSAVLKQVAETAARAVNIRLPEIKIPRLPVVDERLAQAALPRSRSLVVTRAPVVPEVPISGNGYIKLRAGAERMLAALVQWHPGSMTEGQMRAHAGMKKSGTFSTYMSDLRRGGLIQENGGMVFATNEGLEYCQHVPQAPQTTEEVLNVWRPKLREGARRMLDVLVGLAGDSISKEDLAAQAEMTNSGTFSTYLGDLRTSRLIVVGRDGLVQADKETLFL